MLCLIDLARLVDGTLHFGPMPPLDGEWTPIGRIALDSRTVEPGDLFWRLPGMPGQTACSPQHALFRGAAGVVTAEGCAAPWPGTFCLEVASPLAALSRLVDWLEAAESHDFAWPRQNPAELKVLQLCPPQPLVITPPTCGRPTSGPRRCTRQAA
jgi:UDP-N-acetylmuramyl pentapeptide synthase